MRHLALCLNAQRPFVLPAVPGLQKPAARHRCIFAAVLRVLLLVLLPVVFATAPAPEAVGAAAKLLALLLGELLTCAEAHPARCSVAGAVRVGNTCLITCQHMEHSVGEA
jgi:hypothetical protein